MPTDLPSFLLLLARLLLGGAFLYAAYGNFRHFDKAAGFLAGRGVPQPQLVMGAGLAGGSAWAHFNAFDPVLNTGAFKTIKSGGTKTIALVVDTDGYQPKSRGQKGWLIVSLDDENGQFQADLVPVGPDLP